MKYFQLYDTVVLFVMIIIKRLFERRTIVQAGNPHIRMDLRGLRPVLRISLSAGRPPKKFWWTPPQTGTVNVNVNVISRTALIRNRVSRRVFHVSKITWGVLYLIQEAQTHWLPVLGVPPRVVPYTWPILKCCAV